MAQIFFFHNCPKVTAGTIRDHIYAFKRFSKHTITLFDSLTCQYSFCKRSIPAHLDLETFDALVIHYSIYTMGDHMLDPITRARIAAYTGIKIMFIQDEYRLVNKVHDVLRTLGINVLFTCVPEQEIEKVYPAEKLPGLKKINTLTGFVPEELLGKVAHANIAQRPIDVGYRARKLSAWYGQLAQEKYEISDFFAEHNARLEKPLKLDVSWREEDRIYGDAWPRFITSCKAMLGVESGASVFDFTGEIQTNVEAYERANPNASFAEIKEKFFKDEDGKIYLNQISPRCFEAIALKTPLVLYEGNYSGVLKPWQHYIPLKKDFSNFAEVVEKIRDTAFLEQLAERAYNEVALDTRWTYAHFIAAFDEAVDEALAAQKAFAPWMERHHNPQNLHLYVNIQPKLLKSMYECYRLVLAILYPIRAARRLLFQRVLRKLIVAAYHKAKAIYIGFPLPVRKVLWPIGYHTRAVTRKVLGY